MTDFTFASTPLLYAGIGKRNLLPTAVKLFGTRVLLVTGVHSFKNSSFYPECMQLLQSHGFTIHTAAVNREPSPVDVDNVVSTFAATAIDCVVAIGGGSVLDAGKAIAAMLPLQEPVHKYLEGVGQATHPGVKIPVVAIPTTAGTGTEATKNAVLTKVGAHGYKKSLRHNNFVPNVAIIDPELTLSCPKEITAASGMDAFTQLLESYLSTAANSLTDAWAFDGLRRISHSLLTAYHNGDNLHARGDVAIAAYLSGVTLANAGLGVVHGFASAVGGYYQIAHGVICSALMPAANRITVQKLRITNQSSAALKKYSVIGKLFTSDQSRSDDYYVDFLLETIASYQHEMAIPSLKQCGVGASDFPRILAATDCKNNPIQLAGDELEDILTQS